MKNLLNKKFLDISVETYLLALVAGMVIGSAF